MLFGIFKISFFIPISSSKFPFRACTGCLSSNHYKVFMRHLSNTSHLHLTDRETKAARFELI